MAVKIRCSECRKKISVDEAFAGSMCRCPYCKSIVQVPRLLGAGGDSQRPSRPMSHTVRPAAPRIKTSGGSGLEHITGSRPILSGDAISKQRRPAGPTIIEKPGVPQVSEGVRRPPAPMPGAPARPTEKPDVTKAPPPPSRGPAEDALSSLAGAARTTRAPASPKAPAPPSPVEPSTPSPIEPEAKVGENGVVEAIHVDESSLSQEQMASIPMASPVFLQGIVTLVLIIVLILMGTASVYLGMKMFSKPKPEQESAYVGQKEPDVPKELPNPFRVGSGGPKVCQTLPIQPPVVYVIEGGDAMGDMYLFARDAVRASVRSLGAGDSFGVVVAQDPDPLLVGGKMFSGGPDGDAATRPLMMSAYDENPDQEKVKIGGAPNLLQAVEAALPWKPKTLVLIVRNNELPDPVALGQRIGQAGARLVLIAMGFETDEEKNSYLQAVEAAGNDAKAMLYDADRILQEYHDTMDVPE